MHRWMVAAAMAMVFPASALADVHVTVEHRTEIHEDGELVSTKKTGEETIWVGSDRLAYVTPRLGIVVDRGRNRLTFFNRGVRQYVEMPLPLELSAHLSDELAERYRNERTTGTVHRTGETRTVLGVPCDGFEVQIRNLEGDRTVREQTGTVWVSREDPFDLSLYREMLDALRRIHNRDETLRAALDQMKGKQMCLEFPSSEDGREVRYVEEVVSIIREDPPAHAYEVPEGYERRESLTTELVR